MNYRKDPTKPRHPTSHTPPLPGVDFERAVREIFFPDVPYLELTPDQRLWCLDRAKGLLRDASVWPGGEAQQRPRTNKSPRRRAA